MTIKTLSEILVDQGPALPAHWQLRMISHEECLSYLVWNEESREALIVDPKRGSHETFLNFKKQLSNYRWLGVVDTHTHADHVSAAAEFADLFQAPLIMHQSSPCTRIHLRICRETLISTQSGALRFIPTPGHTQDGICLSWGPFAFTGDTVLYGDVGRDDLPTGNATEHYESIQKLKTFLKPETLILPGHDNKGGRASRWSTQLDVNSSLTQGREDFVRECEAFKAAAPTNFKESLVENFR